jgi:hypothetical protein
MKAACLADATWGELEPWRKAFTDLMRLADALPVRTHCLVAKRESKRADNSKSAADSGFRTKV